MQCALSTYTLYSHPPYTLLTHSTHTPTLHIHTSTHYTPYIHTLYIRTLYNTCTLHAPNTYNIQMHIHTTHTLYSYLILNMSSRPLIRFSVSTAYKKSRRSNTPANPLIPYLRNVKYSIYVYNIYYTNMYIYHTLLTICIPPVRIMKYTYTHNIYIYIHLCMYIHLQYTHSMLYIVYYVKNTSSLYVYSIYITYYIVYYMLPYLRNMSTVSTNK